MPTRIAPRHGLNFPAEAPLWPPQRSRKPCKCWRALPVTGIAVARARTGSRIASCAASGSQTDEPAVLHPVSLPFWRRGTRQPGATLETGMPPERPLTQPDQNAIMGSNTNGPLNCPVPMIVR
jgi:hypothetical protein